MFSTIITKYKTNVLCLSLLGSPSRFSCCMSSSSAGAQRGLVSRGMAFCVRRPTSQIRLPVPLHPPLYAAALAPPCLTPAPAVLLQTLAPPLRLEFLTVTLFIMSIQSLYELWESSAHLHCFWFFFHPDKPLFIIGGKKHMKWSIISFTHSFS